MSGTIYYNVTYGVEHEVTKEEVEEACRRADALEFINNFEEGFNTDVGEFGGNLSGGQRQRICIARAILNNPDILLLDESTSNLDMESQYNVCKALDEIRRNKTTIVIAHKLSTVRNADAIVVIKDGYVDAIGKHEELIQSNKLYKDIIEIQAFA